MATLKITGRDPIAAARDILLLAGVDVVEEREIPFGVSFRLDRGRMANVYTSGSVLVQGPRPETIRRVFEDAISKSGTAAPLGAPGPAPAPRPGA